MLDVSFGELAIIVVVAIFVIGPKELPGVIRQVNGWLQQMRGYARQIRQQFDLVGEDNEIARLKAELQEQAKFIRDAEGNLYRTYDISELVAPLPQGEVGEAKAETGEGNHAG